MRPYAESPRAANRHPVRGRDALASPSTGRRKRKKPPVVASCTRSHRRPGKRTVPRLVELRLRCECHQRQQRAPQAAERPEAHCCCLREPFRRPGLPREQTASQLSESEWAKPPPYQARSLPLPTCLTSPAVEARADVQPEESPRPVPAPRRPRPRPRSTQPWQPQSPSGASLSAARRSPEPSRAKRLSPLDLQTTEPVVGSEMRTYGSTRPETRSVGMTVQPNRVLCSPVRGRAPVRCSQLSSWQPTQVKPS